MARCREKRRGCQGNSKPKTSEKRRPKMMEEMLQFLSTAASRTPSFEARIFGRARAAARRMAPYPTSPRMIPKKMGKMMATGRVGSTSE
jgi:hypothetical protein